MTPEDFVADVQRREEIIARLRAQRSARINRLGELAPDKPLEDRTPGEIARDRAIDRAKQDKRRGARPGPGRRVVGGEAATREEAGF